MKFSTVLVKLTSLVSPGVLSTWWVIIGDFSVITVDVAEITENPPYVTKLVLAGLVVVTNAAKLFVKANNNSSKSGELEKSNAFE